MPIPTARTSISARAIHRPHELVAERRTIGWKPIGRVLLDARLLPPTTAEDRSANQCQGTIRCGDGHEPAEIPQARLRRQDPRHRDLEQPEHKHVNPCWRPGITSAI